MTPNGDYLAGSDRQTDDTEARRSDETVLVEWWCPVPPPGRKNRIVRPGDRHQATSWDEAAGPEAADDAAADDDLEMGW